MWSTPSAAHSPRRGERLLHAAADLSPDRGWECEERPSRQHVRVPGRGAVQDVEVGGVRAAAVCHRVARETRGASELRSDRDVDVLPALGSTFLAFSGQDGKRLACPPELTLVGRTRHAVGPEAPPREARQRGRSSGTTARCAGSSRSPERHWVSCTPVPARRTSGVGAGSEPGTRSGSGSRTPGGADR